MLNFLSNLYAYPMTTKMGNGASKCGLSSQGNGDIL